MKRWTKPQLQVAKAITILDSLREDIGAQISAFSFPHSVGEELAQHFVQRCQALLDDLRRHGITEPDVALALGPENDAGNGRDARLLKQELGDAAAVFVDLCGAGKGIKGTG